MPRVRCWVVGRSIADSVSRYALGGSVLTLRALGDRPPLVHHSVRVPDMWLVSLGSKGLLLKGSWRVSLYSSSLFS